MLILLAIVLVAITISIPLVGNWQIGRLVCCPICHHDHSSRVLVRNLPCPVKGIPCSREFCSWQRLEHSEYCEFHWCSEQARRCLNESAAAREAGHPYMDRMDEIARDRELVVI